MVGAYIGLAIVVVVFASVFMNQVKTTNTSTWSSGEVALWGTLGIIGIATVLYAILRAGGIEA